MFADSLTAGAAGVMTPGHQAYSDAGSLSAELRFITVMLVK